MLTVPVLLLYWLLPERFQRESSMACTCAESFMGCHPLLEKMVRRALPLLVVSIISSPGAGLETGLVLLWENRGSSTPLFAELIWNSALGSADAGGTLDICAPPIYEEARLLMSSSTR